ncbi:MAG: 4'-phosphopantetheinyl transferase family protein [Solirubrobacteraceae bacterium]
MRAEAEAALDGLFPATVAGAVLTLDDEVPCPYPAELDAIAGAAWRRQREFLAGRACAHAALRAIGHDGQPIGSGPMREPLWPAGVVGSISHAGRLAGAVATRAVDAWGVGMDIELLDPPLHAAVQRLVLSPGELRAAPELAKIAFAIKECVYKCLYPRTRWRLDFHDVGVEIDSPSGGWRAAVDRRFRLDGQPLAAMQGRFATCGPYVVVGLVMASAGPDPGTGRSPRGHPRHRACSSASA